jgi:hypothetical protein
MTICTSYAKHLLEPHAADYPRCELCGREWHGIETPSCRGPFARLEERSATQP